MLSLESTIAKLSTASFENNIDLENDDFVKRFIQINNQLENKLESSYKVLTDVYNMSYALKVLIR
jgi:hypothetical protein